MARELWQIGPGKARKVLPGFSQSAEVAAAAAVHLVGRPASWLNIKLDKLN